LGGGVDGTILGSDPRDYFIVPVLAYGVHFDFTLPDSPPDIVLSGRFGVSSFGLLVGFPNHQIQTPIFVSPDPVPLFHVVGEPASLLLLGVGLAGLIAARKAAAAYFQD
jgi:hypothetical protein